MKIRLFFITVLGCFILTFSSGCYIQRLTNKLDKAEYVVEFYETGEVKSITYMENGQKNGLYCAYSRSGELSAKGFYKNDKRTGVWIFMLTDGFIHQKRYYRRGEAIILYRSSLKKL